MAASKTGDSTAELLMVLEAFVGNDGHAERFFRAGELIPADDPAVGKWPARFGPVRSPHVEQTTAAPGERRS